METSKAHVVILEVESPEYRALSRYVEITFDPDDLGGSSFDFDGDHLVMVLTPEDAKEMRGYCRIKGTAPHLAVVKQLRRKRKVPAKLPW